MKNPWLKYTVYRLGVFVVLLTVLSLFSTAWLFNVLISAALAFAFSLFFLSDLRDEISRRIHANRSNTLGSGDPESDLENEILDSEVKQKKTKAKPDSE